MHSACCTIYDVGKKLLSATVMLAKTPLSATFTREKKFL